MRSKSPYERHGMWGSPEYSAYLKAKQRCTSLKDPAYKYYGGRGIKFRFKSFGEFYKELGKRPKSLTLDRIDNNGNYEPGNVRWATHLQQTLNKRRKTGARGTSFHAERRLKQWCARIIAEGRRRSLGYFLTEEEAHLAYLKARKELYGY